MPVRYQDHRSEGAAVIFTNVDACKLHTLKINGDGTYEVTNVK